MINKRLALSHTIADKSTQHAVRGVETSLDDVRDKLNALTAKPAVSGATGGNAALEALLEALEKLGLIADSTT